jgi:hypothetical protein
VEKLNDYVRGAFEALSWVHSLLDVEDQKNPEFVNRIENALTDIRKGVAVDFLWRLKSH